MGVSTLTVERFLAGTAGSPLLGEFCRGRALPVPTDRETADPDLRAALVRRWAARIEKMPQGAQDALLQELEAVADLAAPLGNAHLLDTANADAIPPAGVPRGAPLALWFRLRRPDLFDAVHRNHLHRDLDYWRAARVEPCLKPQTPTDAAARLERELALLRSGQGWSVTCHTLHRPGVVALVAHRSPGGSQEPSARGPASDRPLQGDRLEFVWHPDEGTVLLHPGLGPEEDLRALLAAFARSVGTGPILPGPAFDLDRLRWPFAPQPDALELEAIRLKTLHLRYPERDGSRLLVLDTVDADGPTAVADLVARHVPAETLLELTVPQAVLQLRLRVGDSQRHHLVRLYPHYCDLGRGALGERMLACVRRWGL